MKRLAHFPGKLGYACLAGLALAACLMATSAFAQTWPSKPIRVLAAHAPGGGPDHVVRAINNELSKRLGQPVLLEHKPGAGGNIAASELLRTGADGYTWLVGTESILTINPLIYKNVGFNIADLMPVNLIGSFSQVLACNPGVGVKTVPELIAKAKTRPLSYASGGAGSPGHLTMEMLLADANVSMTHIPYRGPQPAVTDMMGGQVDCGFLVGAVVNEFIKAGRLVALATSSKTRSPLAPDLPTVAEQGFPRVDATFWLTLFASRQVPKDILDRFSKALDESIKTPEVRNAMLANGTKVEGMSAEAAQKELEQITLRWADTAKRVNLKLE
jgi:tripartite-type tricarboxylate transporter receptor subunit TctC